VGEDGPGSSGHPGGHVAVIEVGGEGDAPDQSGGITPAGHQRAQRAAGGRHGQPDDAFPGGEIARAEHVEFGGQAHLGEQGQDDPLEVEHRRREVLEHAAPDLRLGAAAAQRQHRQHGEGEHGGRPGGADVPDVVPGGLGVTWPEGK
jgi:hypothetical protein